MRLKYTTIKNGEAIIAVNGEFNTCIKREMDDEIEEILRNNCSKVTIDFQNTVFMDSVGSGIIKKISQQFGENVYAVNANEDILDALHIYSVESDLHIDY